MNHKQGLRFVYALVPNNRRFTERLAVDRAGQRRKAIAAVCEGDPYVTTGECEIGKLVGERRLIQRILRKIRTRRGLSPQVKFKINVK